MKIVIVPQRRRLVLAALFLSTVLPALAFRADPEPATKNEFSAATLAAFPQRAPAADQLIATQLGAERGIKVEWHADLGTPLGIRGTNLEMRAGYSGSAARTSLAGTNFAPRAIGVVANLSRFYGMQDATQEFTVQRSDSDYLGFHHVRLSQMHQGLRVLGGDLIVHFDKNGTAYEVNGRYVPDLQMSITPKLSVGEVEALAQANLATHQKASGTLEFNPELVVFAYRGQPRLAYELTLASRDSQVGPARWRYWMDAQDGTVLLRFNDIKKIAAPTANGTNAVLAGNILTGEGGQSVSVTGWYENTGLYYLYGTNRHWLVYNVATSGYADANTYAYRPTNDWLASDRAEFSTARNIDIVQRYYSQVQGRNSYNNAGILATANVHEGVNYVNAFWDGTALYFGDGDGAAANSLATLDIAGHEFTHAVTEFTAGLIYSYESGALNESFSDVMGTCIEFYGEPDGRGAYPAKVTGEADWLCGEDAWLSSVALRDLRNPRNVTTVGIGNEQPSRYQGSFWSTGSADNGGVHQNSGVQNFFFYLLAEGGSGNNDGISYNITGIGLTNAQLVAYRALTVYCTPSTGYRAVRSAWVSAALDLNPSWADAVGAAWSAVGLGALALSPESTVSFRGPVGGPFTPTTQTYALLNTGSSPMPWTAISSQPWLAMTPTSGTIPVNSTQLVTLTLTAPAASLAAGIYSNTVTFSNSLDAASQSRQVQLLIGQPDFFTELFDTTLNDLTFSAFTFNPNGSASSYALCREPAVAFPTDPTGGTTVTLSDDAFTAVTLSGTDTVVVYNRRTNVFYIGSNGYLTLGAGDSAFSESLVNHFSLPRVAATFDDLNPSTGGTISWKQTSELVAVTFDSVREYGTSATVSFQIELFYDGRIRVTYLAIGITDGLAGISAGLGVPVAFSQSDLSGYAPCTPPDPLVLGPTSSFGAAGYQGGPFVPASATYTLSNSGASSFNWTANANQSWLTLSATAGNLGAGSFTNIDFQINAGALSLPVGSYSANVTVSNLVTGFAQNRGVTLLVAPIPGEIAVLDSVVPATDLLVPFGNVILGLTRTENITVTNSDATHGLTLSNISFAVASAAYQAPSLPSLPLTVPPAGALTFAVVYQPVGAGSNFARLAIVSNDADEPQVLVDLTGQAVPDALQISPTNNFATGGAPGGPFAPAQIVYTMTNAGPAALTWSLTHTQSWVTVSLSAGTLPAGSAVAITGTLNSAASLLPAGNYADSLVISNLTSGVVSRRGAALSLTTPALTIGDATVVEGNSGTTNLVFAVNLAPPTLQTVSVNFATANGTALAGSDFVATNGLLTFAPGQTNASVVVTVIGDTLAEGPETFTVTLASPANGVLADGSANGTIADDDGQIVSLPYNLNDNFPYLWDVQTDGDINNGTSDAYDGGHVLSGFPTFSTALLVGGRELVIGPATLNGLEVSRRIFVPTNYAYARFLEVLRNPGATAITTTVRLDSNLGSDSSTVLVGTSSGDTAFGTNDNWIVTDDLDGSGDPTVLHVIANDGGAIRPSAISYSTGLLGYQYLVPVPAGETRIVLHFGAQSPNRAAALAKAPLLTALQQAALLQVSTLDQTRIVNFGVTPERPPVVWQANPGNGTVALSWSGSGFHLQAQTNGVGIGLSTNWFDYPGGASSPVTITPNPANSSVFYRLVYP